MIIFHKLMCITLKLWTNKDMFVCLFLRYNGLKKSNFWRENVVSRFSIGNTWCTQCLYMFKKCGRNNKLFEIFYWVSLWNKSFEKMNRNIGVTVQKNSRHSLWKIKRSYKIFVKSQKCHQRTSLRKRPHGRICMRL